MTKSASDKTSLNANNTGNPLLNPGQKVFIRTVTHYYTGEVVSAHAAEQGIGGWLELREASWVADTGHFGQAMANGKFAEVEAYPEGMRVIVNLGAVVDICDWTEHELTNLKKGQ